MNKTRVLVTQLRLPLITYYVTVVDPVAGTTVSVVDHNVWHATLIRYRDRIERIEHKAFGSGLVANLVLKNPDNCPHSSLENDGGFRGGESVEDPARSEVSKAKRLLGWIVQKLLPSGFAIFGGSGRS